MKRTTIELIARYLFYGLPLLFAILGQSHCTNIDIGDGQLVFSFNKNKLIFLKIMPQQLFTFLANSWPFSNENILLIDDFLEKSV